MPRNPNNANHLTKNDQEFGAYVIATDGQPALAVVNTDGSQISGGGGSGGNVNLNQVGGVSIGLGQTTKANSLPVVLPSDQIVPVSGTVAVSNLPTVQSTAETTGLNPKVYDYISYTATSSTVDTYLFKTGGSGGTLTSTITITYTDSTHNTIVSVART